MFHWNSDDKGFVLQSSSRNSMCRTWHLLPRHPDAVAAVRVCRPMHRHRRSCGNSLV